MLLVIMGAGSSICRSCHCMGELTGSDIAVLLCNE